VSFTTDPIGGLAKRRPTYLITLPFGRRVAREDRRFDVWTTPPLEGESTDEVGRRGGKLHPRHFPP
jgi:hypothetical protein